ncbi:MULTISPECIES: entericidin A/B family lipoprotein [Erwiniaceae]|uniref:Entericidin A/B family lipoprotein n=2 Tax=Erwiniaceae TaxID=1903409 RepID=A0ACC5RL13_ENTAG|nr:MULTISPECIES: entericidin A/B family lipoprotein [Erwiniaceae]MBK4725190.1 entericidin A/B family lipoprotein [Pantoea agglomerans]MBP2152918.1 entericidin A [Erwinia rhapontici]MCS3608261.1 entericidin A [Erwinia rhapontici]NKG31615.1 entericidin A/B family lipoprotein [Erwinia rhapontici]NNS08187.1 entericidin A/B family lipoprotein [Erwinia sp. JH02]
MLKFIAVALLMTCALSACNTFHGFGEDVQHLGGAITDAANK